METLELEGPIVCIAGPTASGKTDYAIRVARTVNGEIVNADALQVYADLSVLSARPSNDEMQDVPHHLFGHVDGRTAYSTGAWVRDARPVLQDISERGRVPVIVGGTGLYFQALLDGLADIPDVPEALQIALDATDVAELREEAERIDPDAAARILGDDPQRLARLVGVHRATGRTLSQWRADTRPAIRAEPLRRAVLLPDRDRLYARINARFDGMIAAGAIDEAAAVRAKDYPARSPMLKAIGLSHLLSYLDGDCDLADAVKTAKRDTRRLAKRQMTWFRNRCGDWPMLVTQDDRDAFLHSLKGF
ncbi:MAG: tRNA (adenosine(37)-N6)-dimethylallyltransferase MiaA [Pseudomonadota bacterium]